MQSRIDHGGVIERQTYPSDDLSIDVWVTRPQCTGKVPVVVYNHGSRLRPGGDIDAGRSAFSFGSRIWHGVAAGRCAVVFPEGRGYGKSTGPRLEDCHNWTDVRRFLRGRAEDVVKCLEWLENQNWADTSKVVLAGCSHGGIVTLLAQADAKVCGSVIQAPSVGDQSKDIAAPEIKSAVERTCAPILVQHANHDLHAPIEFSRSLRNRFQSLNKPMRMIEYPYSRSTPSHDVFNWENRDVWASDFDSFLVEKLGLDGGLICERACRN